MALPFLYPLPNRVTSPYGDNDRDSHYGVDIVGKPEPATYSDQIAVYSVTPGKVIEKRDIGERGLTYIIQAPNTDRIYYQHFGTSGATINSASINEYMSPNVNVGDSIGTHTYLGIMGESGKSRGAHLHFEVHRRNVNGVYTPIDPMATLGLPIKDRNYTTDITYYEFRGVILRKEDLDIAKELSRAEFWAQRAQENSEEAKRLAQVAADFLKEKEVQGAQSRSILEQRAQKQAEQNNIILTSAKNHTDSWTSQLRAMLERLKKLI